MSLALSTLVIALLALLPGASFYLFLTAGKFKHIRENTSLPAELALAVAMSIPIHLLSLLTLDLLGLYPGIDYRLLVHVIAGSFDEEGLILRALAEHLARNTLPIAGYIFLTVIVAFLLGKLSQYLLIRIPPLERLVPVRNEWFHKLVNPRGRISYSYVYVLTSTIRRNSHILYRGPVADFDVGVDGSLSSITVASPERSREPQPKQVLTPFDQPETSRSEWVPLKADVLTIPGNRIENVAIEYVRVARPILVVARRVITVEITHGDGLVSTTLEFKRGQPGVHTLLLWFCRSSFGQGLLPTGLVTTIPGLMQSRLHVTASLESDLRVTVNLAGPAGIHRVAVTLAVFFTTHQLAEHTGNFLFFFEKAMLEWKAKRVEQRIRSMPIQ